MVDPSRRQAPLWLVAVLFVAGVPLALYGFAHIDEWPRRGPGGGEGANHVAVLAALTGGVLTLFAGLSLLARWLRRDGDA
jgi:hypothetical protein